jgi:ketosteroid isomerase-like protein
MSTANAGTLNAESMKDLLHALGGRWMESDPDGMMEFWNDDGRYEFPYAPEAFGFPKVVQGKEALHKYLSYLLTQIKDITIGNWVARQTTDPNVWYVEYTASATAAPTGRHYEQIYIARVELKNGRFQVYREFWDPYVLLDSLGMVQAKPASSASA